MSAPGSDGPLRRPWLVIGFVALAFLLALLLVGGGVLPEWGSGGSRVVAAPTGAPAADGPPRAVRFSLPDRIRGTDALLALVRHGAAYEEISGEGTTRLRVSSPYGSSDPIVNVIVVSAAGGGRLIFDQPVYILEVLYPGSSARGDSLQTWIAYEVVLDDSNGDQELDDGDARTLFVSDLGGANLRRVLPEGWSLLDQMTLADHRTILITALRRPADAGREWEGDEEPQRAFLYDVARNEFRPFTTLDSLVTRAGIILAHPGKPK